LFVETNGSFYAQSRNLWQQTGRLQWFVFTVWSLGSRSANLKQSSALGQDGLSTIRKSEKPDASAFNGKNKPAGAAG
jgi:hypothetical protein